jgi:hypothetical protein
MKRRRHQSDTSEVALMAVMTKAMGAFLILMVFAMQYYIPDFTAEQIAAIVNRSISGVRQDLASAVERMKRGDFTKEELEELQRQIDVALAKLSQAESDIARLQTRLDQSVSQLKRIEGDRARLEAEGQSLRAEIARLRAFDPSAMQAAIERLTGELSDKLAEVEALKNQLHKLSGARALSIHMKYQNCGDEIIALAVARQDGRDGKSTSLIPVDGSTAYTPVGRSFAPTPEGTNTYFTFLADPVYGEEVSQVWLAHRALPGDTYAIYLNDLNRAMEQRANTQGPSIEESSCRVRLSIYDGKTNLNLDQSIGATNPFAFGKAVRVTQDALVPVNTSSSEAQWFQRNLLEAPCKALTCDPNSQEARKTVFGLLEGIYQYRLSRTPTPRIQVDPNAVNQIIDDLKTGFLSGRFTQNSLSRFAALAIAPPAGSVTSGAAPGADIIAETRKRLADTDIPSSLQREFLTRASQGWWSSDEFERRIQSVAKTTAPAPSPAGPTSVENPGRVIALLRTLTDTGFMTPDVAARWSVLVKQMPPSPPAASVPTGLNRNEIIAQMTNKGFPPEFASFVAGRMMSGAIKLDDYIYAMKVTKGNTPR